MSFAHPYWLGLVIPWCLLMMSCWWRQRPALDYVERRVGERFRPVFSRHSVRSGRRHLQGLTLMGLLLIVAAAQPYLPDTEDTLEVEAPDVLLLLDASASMNAGDVDDFGGDEPVKSRFEVAQRLAGALVESMPDARFGLITYSGVATIQLPLVQDHETVLDALRVAEIHNFYQNTGSNLRSALEAIMPYAVDRSSSLQVVMLGDGEIPPPREGEDAEDFSDAMEALVHQEVPIHTLSIGSLTGQNRLIFDFRDVVAGKDEKTVLRDFTTRRVDRHFKKISRATGGFFSPAEVGSARELADAIALHGREASIADEQARFDLTWFFVLAFGVLWLAERLLLGPKPASQPDFDLNALGSEPAGEPDAGRGRGLGKVLPVALITIIGGCGDDLLERAHRVNERGIQMDVARLHGAAQRQYEKSRAYGIRVEIPTYNQARSAMLEQEYAEAHRLFQAALEIQPELAEALYNDGVTLYEWGVAERDPKDCRLERTLDLWQNARIRFSTASEVAGEALAQDADRNEAFLGDQLEMLDELIESPPAHCFEQSQGSQGGAQGSQGGSQGSQGGSQGSQGGSQGSQGGSQGSQGGSQGSQGGSQGSQSSGQGGNPSGDSEVGSSGAGADDPEGQNPEGQDPEGQDPEGQDPEGQDPEGQDPEGQDPEGQDPEGQDPGGSQDPGRSGGAGSSSMFQGGSGGEPKQELSAEQLAEIEKALARIADQGREEGHYHRRSFEEQFSETSWRNPQAEIWW